MTSTTWVKRLAIILFWLVAWQGIAWAAGNSLLLCGPLEALQALGRLLPLSTFWESLGCSLGRIGIGFIIAAAAGAALGAAARIWPLVGSLLAPLMSVVKGAPIVCIIVLLLVLLGSSHTTVVVVALVVAPPFYIAVRQAEGVGRKGIDDMLKVFSVGRWRRFLCVRWPAAAPFLRAAAGTAAAMAWKAGVAAELIGLPASSIGEQVYLAKLTLDTPGIIAWTAVAVLMGWLSEKLVAALLGALEKIPHRWLGRRIRQTAATDTSREPFSQPAAIVFDDVSKTFGDHPVLSHLSFDLRSGDRMALMAPSGAGKTTILRLALGLEHPDSGIIERTPGPQAAVFQESTLIESLSAAENLALVAQDPAELRSGLDILQQLINDGSMAGKAASQLSGGMRRRVEIARALAHPSGLLALDEPFTGLDEETRGRTLAIVSQHLDGRTLLLATHEAQDASMLEAAIAGVE